MNESYGPRAVDDRMGKEGDNQTIAIILCKSKHQVMAEYA